MVSNTQARVFEAADELLQEGCRPTQQSVRERIGQGSVTTINKALNRWWAELGARVQGRRRMPALPEPVEHAIIDLWQLALTHAQHGADQVRQEAAAKLRQEREQLDRERQAQQQALSANQQQLERAFDRIESLQQQLEAARDRETKAEQEAVSRERRQLAAEREQRTLEAENRKLTESLYHLEQENKILSIENEGLASLPNVVGDKDDNPDQRLLEEENRNLRTALGQADIRFGEQADELAQLRTALQACEQRCALRENGQDGS